MERVNERLKRDNQYKTDFLAIVSHELREPRIDRGISFPTSSTARSIRSSKRSSSAIDRFEPEQGRIFPISLRFAVASSNIDCCYEENSTCANFSLP